MTVKVNAQGGFGEKISFKVSLARPEFERSLWEFCCYDKNGILRETFAA